jgi:hypothetical protein
MSAINLFGSQSAAAINADFSAIERCFDTFDVPDEGFLAKEEFRPSPSYEGVSFSGQDSFIGISPGFLH